MTDSSSPLAEIRAAELAAARSVATESERADAVLAEARREAIRLIDLARAAGSESADRRFAAAVVDAEERAGEIARDLEVRSTVLRERVEPQLAALAEAMLETVLPRSGQE